MSIRLNRLSRRDALGVLGGVSAVLASRCSSDSPTSPTTQNSTPTTTTTPPSGNSITCAVSPNETVGPFPSLSDFVRSDVRENKPGLPLTLTITVVNTASVSGLTGYGGVLYGTTKAAVVGMTRTLAIEVADKDIRINSVCPAGMLTNYGDLNPDHPNADQIKISMGRMHPLGRAIDPEDTAAAAMFLASDLASNITGVNLPVDGGLTAGRKVGG